LSKSVTLVCLVFHKSVDCIGDLNDEVVGGGAVPHFHLSDAFMLRDYRSNPQITDGYPRRDHIKLVKRTFIQALDEFPNLDWTIRFDNAAQHDEMSGATE
jgi:hypothetical protein